MGGKREKAGKGPPLLREPVTIITTCMGRLDFLKQALPTWGNHPKVVVDYSCPQNCGEWAKDQAEIVKVRGEEYFNLSRARNAGARGRTGVLAFLDADALLSPDFWSWVFINKKPGNLIVCENRSMGGLIIVDATAFHALGGFNESFEGWGYEDVDMRKRLEASGLRKINIPKHLFSTLPHSDETRVANYRIKDKLLSDQLNRSLAQNTPRGLP